MLQLLVQSSLVCDTTQCMHTHYIYKCTIGGQLQVNNICTRAIKYIISVKKVPIKILSHSNKCTLGFALATATTPISATAAPHFEISALSLF